jgi:hypothetical protein
MTADLLQGCRQANRPLQNPIPLDSTPLGSLTSKRQEARAGRIYFVPLKTTKLVRELPNQVKLSDDCRRIVAPDMTILDAVRRLQGEYALSSDAIRMLPHAFPKRVAVWWGCLVAKRFGQHEADAPSQQILQAVDEWVHSPGEEQRRTVEALAKQSELLSPATNLAMAAFLSGGSLTPPGLPVVEPRSWLTPQLVGAAVLMTLGIAKEGTLFDRCREAIHLGLELAPDR